MNKQKRIAAIHDISGLGKCSLTVALPILSAAGIEVSTMPTALLSSHTGGLPNDTYRDLSADMLAFVKQWTVSPEMVEGMVGLCGKADLIVPNFTEAAFLLGEKFREGPYTREYVEDFLRRLSALGPKQVVITGVWFSPDLFGAAGCIRRTREAKTDARFGVNFEAGLTRFMRQLGVTEE